MGINIYLQTLTFPTEGLFLAQYQVLRKNGHTPSEAFNETVEEATQSLYPLIGQKGCGLLPISIFFSFTHSPVTVWTTCTMHAPPLLVVVPSTGLPSSKKQISPSSRNCTRVLKTAPKLANPLSSTDVVLTVRTSPKSWQRLIAKRYGVLVCRIHFNFYNDMCAD